MTLITAALIYFLISLHRCWMILRNFSPRTTPARAVGFSLIPFFNLYWVFVSIYGLAVDANAFAEQKGSSRKINETLSIVTCFILMLPFVNFLAPIFMTFLVYQWAGFNNAADYSARAVYPISGRNEYLKGKFNAKRVFACGLAGIVIILAGAEIIKDRRQEGARVAATEWVDKGSQHLKAAEYDEAIKAYTSAISVSPHYEEAYYNRAMAYNRKGLPDLEIADLNKVIMLGPTIPKTYFYRGSAYLQKRQYDLAIGDFSKAISLNTSEIEMAYGGRGLAYSLKGNFNMAIPDFKKACEMGYGLSCKMLAEAQMKK